MVLTLTVVLALLPHIVWLLMWIVSKVFRFTANYAPYGWTAIGLVALTWTLLAYGFFIGRWKVQQVEWTYENADIPASFNGMRIVHISDLHLSTFQDNPHKLEEFVEQINATHPDLICITGDLVSLRLEELAPHISTLRQLKASHGVCSVLGNHDFFLYSSQYRTDREKVTAVDSLAEMQRAQLGWHLLRNESYTITQGADTLTIIGVDNSNCSNQGFRTIHRGDLKKAMQGTSGFRILLSHDPSHWTAEVIPHTDIPLTLSGHTHGAQIRLFGWTPASWVFNETCGRYDNGSQTLYINIGLGCTAPVRFGANPEITVITLKNKACHPTSYKQKRQTATAIQHTPTVVHL